MSCYTIREVAARFGLPASTLRYYEETGLLPPVPKTKAGQRMYGEEHIGRLYAIECFKNTGMSIAQMKDFFTYEADEEGHIDDMLCLLDGQKTELENRLKKLNDAHAHIRCKLDYYSEVKASLSAGGKKPDWESFIAARNRCSCETEDALPPALSDRHETVSQTGPCDTSCNH